MRVEGLGNNTSVGCGAHRGPGTADRRRLHTTTTRTEPMKRHWKLALGALVVVPLVLFATGCEKDEPAAESDWVIEVTANPGSLDLAAPDEERTSTITAFVYNDKGVPQGGIGVRFSATAGFMESGSQVVETRSDGSAQDVLHTNQDTTVFVKSGSAEGKTEVTIGNVNERPAAVLTITPADQQLVGETVTFSGAQSDDLDGIITEYRWTIVSTIPANNENVVTGEGETSLQRSYSQPQDLEVSLVVVDDDGATSSPPAVENYAIVENKAPTADAGGPYQGMITPGDPPGDPTRLCTVTVNGCNSFDPPPGQIVTYQWDWGGEGPPDFINGECTTSHTFWVSDGASVHDVTLTVWDDGANGECGAVSATNPDTCPTRGRGESITDKTNVTCPAKDTN
jgi:hypothetical protein